MAASCTSSFRVSCGAVMDGTGLAEFFPEDRRTTLDDVKVAKPDPEAYLRAAGTIGVPAMECVALEDSAPGVGSAVAAGYGLVIGVLSTSAGAHVTFPSTVAAVEFLLAEGGGKSASELASSAGAGAAKL